MHAAKTISCVCVNCGKTSLQKSFDEEDMQRKAPKKWFCGCNLNQQQDDVAH